MTLPLVVAAVAGSMAAVTHGWMFTIESVLFDRRSTQRMLEVPQDHVAAVRLWAYHQGIYNLLLGGIGAAGVIALLVGAFPTGRTLLFAAGVAMVAAALALIGGDRRRSRVPGFLAQALPAAICLTALTVSA